MSVPTARIFLQNLIEENNHDSNIDIEDALIEFAKLHVKQALESAAEKLPYDDKLNQDILVKRLILNAYPLDKIK